MYMKESVYRLCFFYCVSLIFLFDVLEKVPINKMYNSFKFLFLLIFSFPYSADSLEDQGSKSLGNPEHHQN